MSNNGLTEAEALAKASARRFLRTAVSDSAAESFAVPVTLVEAAYRYRNEERDARFFVVERDETEIPAPTDANSRNSTTTIRKAIRRPNIAASS